MVEEATLKMLKSTTGTVQGGNTGRVENILQEGPKRYHGNGQKEHHWRGRRGCVLCGAVLAFSASSLVDPDTKSGR